MMHFTIAICLYPLTMLTHQPCTAPKVLQFKIQVDKTCYYILSLSCLCSESFTSNYIIHVQCMCPLGLRVGVHEIFNCIYLLPLKGPNTELIGPVVFKKETFTSDVRRTPHAARRTTCDGGRQPIALAMIRSPEYV